MREFMFLTEVGPWLLTCPNNTGTLAGFNNHWSRVGCELSVKSASSVNEDSTHDLIFIQKHTPAAARALARDFGPALRSAPVFTLGRAVNHSPAARSSALTWTLTDHGVWALAEFLRVRNEVWRLEAEVLAARAAAAKKRQQENLRELCAALGVAVGSPAILPSPLAADLLAVLPADPTAPFTFVFNEQLANALYEVLS